MLRFITLLFFILFTCIAYSQGFPDAQKQPRFKENRARQKHYAKQARRRHIRRGTALLQYDSPIIRAIPVYFLADNRRLIKNII
jgi:hypothetical protein